MKCIAIVTGASSGMGREAAIEIARDNKNWPVDEIWLIARRKELLEEVASEIEALTTRQVSECPEQSPTEQSPTGGAYRGGGDTASLAEQGADEADEADEAAEHSAAESMGQEHKSVPIVLDLDISSKEGLSAFRDRLSKEDSNGGIRVAILVNNAGFGTYGPFTETSSSRLINMVDLNCTAVTGILSYTLPYMGRQAVSAGAEHTPTEQSPTGGAYQGDEGAAGGKRGCRTHPVRRSVSSDKDKDDVIINTASLAGFMPLGNFALYGATKAFVLSLSLALAAEVKDRGIKVCALCPGPVSTQFALVASGGARKEVRHGVSASQVVKRALQDARRGKAISMMRSKWRFTAFMSRFASRSLIAWITYKFYTRPHKT